MNGGRSSSSFLSWWQRKLALPNVLLAASIPSRTSNPISSSSTPGTYRNRYGPQQTHLSPSVNVVTLDDHCFPANQHLLLHCGDIRTQRQERYYRTLFLFVYRCAECESVCVERPHCLQLCQSRQSEWTYRRDIRLWWRIGSFLRP